MVLPYKSMLLYHNLTKDLFLYPHLFSSKVFKSKHSHTSHFQFVLLSTCNEKGIHSLSCDQTHEKENRGLHFNRKYKRLEILNVGQSWIFWKWNKNNKKIKQGNTLKQLLEESTRFREKWFVITCWHLKMMYSSNFTHYN